MQNLPFRHQVILLPVGYHATMQ